MGNRILDTKIKKGYVFSFSIEENSDFSYVVIDYPHLKIDTTQIRLETFDFANSQYISVDTLTSNFRSFRKIKGIRINRVSLKVRSHNKNKLWKLHFDGLLTRLDTIELVKIQLRNSKFENFIEKNIYSKKEIKELKERYDEMVWRKDLLENGIQFEIRLKRDDEFSQPEVKKLIQIGVDKKTNELSVTKSRNNILYKANLHISENAYVKSGEYKEDYKNFPSDTARDNLFYDFYNDGRRIVREKSDKYNFQNLIPGWDYAKVKEIYLRIKYSLQQNEKLRTVSSYSNNAISFLKSKTQHERLSVQYKYLNSTRSYRIKMSDSSVEKEEIYNISDTSNIEVSEPTTDTTSWVSMNKDQIISTFSTEIFNVTPSWESSVKKIERVYI